MTDQPPTTEVGPSEAHPAGPEATRPGAPEPPGAFEPPEAWPPATEPPDAREPLEPSLPVPEPRSRLVAGVLGIVLGGLGAHSLYLGYGTKAKLQLAVSIVTCGIGGIWGATEGVLILVQHEAYREDAHGVPLVD